MDAYDQMTRPSRGEVWWWNSERQSAGCLQKSNRPVIVVSNDVCNANSSVITVVPLTTKVHRSFPQQVPVVCNGRISVALGDQVQCVPIEELTSYFGKLEGYQMERVNKILLVQLGLENGH